MIEEIEAEASEERVATHSEVLGRAAVLAADPLSQLAWQSQTRAPSVHAVDRSVRRALKEALRLRSMAYDAASQRFRSGEWGVAFPAGMFRPLGGFVV